MHPDCFVSIILTKAGFVSIILTKAGNSLPGHRGVKVGKSLMSAWLAAVTNKQTNMYILRSVWAGVRARITPLVGAVPAMSIRFQADILRNAVESKNLTRRTETTPSVVAAIPVSRRWVRQMM